VDNPVENSARANGGPRALFVHRDVVESYIDYALERRKILEARGVCDTSPHVSSTSTPRTDGLADP
jgi:integrase/recombinase XerD